MLKIHNADHSSKRTKLVSGYTKQIEINVYWPINVKQIARYAAGNKKKTLQNIHTYDIKQKTRVSNYCTENKQ